MEPRRAIGLTVIAIMDFVFGFLIIFTIPIFPFVLIGLLIACNGFFMLDITPSPGVKIANICFVFLILAEALGSMLQVNSNGPLFDLKVLFCLWGIVYLIVSLIRSALK